jgi:transglutaminase-like putative cysteine protease
MARARDDGSNRRSQATYVIVSDEIIGGILRVELPRVDRITVFTRGELSMIIRAGYNISFNCVAQTPMLLLLNVHPSRSTDLRSPDVIKVEPDYPSRAYFDLFGNRVTRLVAGPGPVSFSNDFLIYDDGKPDESPADTLRQPVAALPDDVLVYLISSRYCDSDVLSTFAWSHFGTMTGGAQIVRAICDFVHGHIRFSYPNARPDRTASDAMREQIGVCRDFAHLSIALCRAMNIPARYCTGYLGDIGVPADPAPMDFSAWFEAFLDGRWYTFDARHNHPRIGRIVMARGRDAADVAISTAFGLAPLVRFDVTTIEAPALRLSA